MNIVDGSILKIDFYNTKRLDSYDIGTKYAQLRYLL